MLRRPTGGQGAQSDGDFSVETEKLSDDCYQVSVSGDLDLDSAPELRTTIDGLYGQRLRKLILGLTDCTFIDSTGLQAVLQSTRGLDHGDAELLLAGPRGPVRRVLDVTGVANMVLIYPTVEQARRAAVG
jgi:anti-sigma B factor antagonist